MPISVKHSNPAMRVDPDDLIVASELGDGPEFRIALIFHCPITEINLEAVHVVPATSMLVLPMDRLDCSQLDVERVGKKAGDEAHRIPKLLIELILLGRRKGNVLRLFTFRSNLLRQQQSISVMISRVEGDHTLAGFASKGFEVGFSLLVVGVVGVAGFLRMHSSVSLAKVI